MRWTSIGLCATTLFSIASIANGQYPQQNVYTRNGAILGGVTGAVIGGVVGHQRNDTAEGILIGGAVGAVAGGVLGNNRDHQERQRYQPYHYHQTQSRQVYVTQPQYVEQRTYVPVRSAPIVTKVGTSRPVTASEVISMSQSGVSDAVIVSHIQANGIASTPDVNEIIWMSEKGVSDYVITYMQQNGKVRPQVYTKQPSEVIIREEYHPTTTTVIQSSPTPVYVQRRGF